MTERHLDTIVATATAPGVGAVAVVRLSGPDAARVLARVAPALASPLPARQATLATIVDPGTGEEVDRGLVTWFPAPASYTGEDVVEISGHGGFLAPLLVVEACRAAGARPAEPGEFTRRAWAHGKLDLIQAEAVADLIEGRSRALHRAALGQLDRGLSDRIDALRRELIDLEAVLVHHVDFPEEDDLPVSTDEIARRADALSEGLSRLASTAAEGELLRRGALAVLAGRPNTGKSSLFNALVGQERALVTEVPGTTRDAVEAEVSLGGYPFRLVDTAGLRETDERIERMGIEVARRYLDAADLVLFCAEAGRALDEDERAFLERERPRRPVVVVRTQSDRVGPSDTGDDEGVRVSVVSGEGLERVREAARDLAFGGLVRAAPDSPVLTRRRHADGVARARGEVDAFAAALRDGVPVEVAAAHLAAATTALEEVMGVVTREEVLDHLFRSFCIGK